MEVGDGPTERETLSVTTGDKQRWKERKEEASIPPTRNRREEQEGHIMYDLAQIYIWIKSSLCPSFSVSFLYHQLISLLDHSHQHINVL